MASVNYEKFCKEAVKQITAQKKLAESDFSFFGQMRNNNGVYFSSVGANCPKCGTEGEKEIDPSKYISHYAVECPKCKEGMYVQIINEFDN